MAAQSVSVDLLSSLASVAIFCPQSLVDVDRPCAPARVCSFCTTHTFLSFTLCCVCCSAVPWLLLYTPVWCLLHWHDNWWVVHVLCSLPLSSIQSMSLSCSPKCLSHCLTHWRVLLQELNAHCFCWHLMAIDASLTASKLLWIGRCTSWVQFGSLCCLVASLDRMLSHWTVHWWPPVIATANTDSTLYSCAGKCL